MTGELLRTYANPVAGGYNNFGENIVGVAGNVVVSAYTDDSGGNNAGAAYLFNGATEELIAVLQQDPTPVADAMFGWSLAVVGNTVAIGSRSGTTPVQVFNGKTGEFLYSLSNPGAADDDFGRSIAAVGSTIAVGAMLCDASGEPNAGAAYLFEAPEPSSALLLLMAATVLAMRRWVGKRVER